MTAGAFEAMLSFVERYDILAANRDSEITLVRLQFDLVLQIIIGIVQCANTDPEIRVVEIEETDERFAVLL